MLNPELTLQFYSRALTLTAPASTDHKLLSNIYSQIGQCSLQLGNAEQSLVALRKAIEFDEQNAELWFRMGQVSEGQEALKCYGQGAGILTPQLDTCDKKDDEKMKSLRTQLSQACCNVADLYMTDLCFESDAEEKTTNAVTMSFGYNHGGVAGAGATGALHEMPHHLPDPYQSLANLRLSQQKPWEASLAILKVWDGFLEGGCRAGGKLSGVEWGGGGQGGVDSVVSWKMSL